MKEQILNALQRSKWLLVGLGAGIVLLVLLVVNRQLPEHGEIAPPAVDPVGDRGAAAGV